MLPDSRLPARPAVRLGLGLTLSAGMALHIGQNHGPHAPRDVDRRAPHAAAADRRDVGRIAGSVEISTALSKRRASFRIYADAGPGGTPTATTLDPMSQLANVVIYLESDAHRPLSAAGPQVIMRVRSAMAQSNERFQPHVLPVLLGATVEFPNQDDVFHNVFSLSATSKFDLGRYPKGASKSVRFDKPGAVQVFCHIHADMSAIVLVLSNPFFATPDAAGRFAIDDVPPGEYTIVGWHERTKPVVRHVTVAAAQTTTLDFNIPVSAPARTASR